MCDLVGIKLPYFYHEDNGGTFECYMEGISLQYN